MNKIIIMLISLILLTSCGYPTEQELKEQKKVCDLNGEELYIVDNLLFSGGNAICRYKRPPTSVMDCVREYTDGLDEKYNNPDTVSDLREDNYSQVVKTCNEIFGENPNNLENDK